MAAFIVLGTVGGNYIVVAARRFKNQGGVCVACMFNQKNRNH